MLSQERPLAVNLPHLSRDKFYQAFHLLNFCGKGSTAREEGLGTRLGDSTIDFTKKEAFPKYLHPDSGGAMKTFPVIVQLAYSALVYPNSIWMETEMNFGYFPGSLIYPTEADI